MKIYEKLKNYEKLKVDKKLKIHENLRKFDIYLLNINNDWLIWYPKNITHLLQLDLIWYFLAIRQLMNLD